MQISVVFQEEFIKTNEVYRFTSCHPYEQWFLGIECGCIRYCCPSIIVVLVSSFFKVKNLKRWNFFSGRKKLIGEWYAVEMCVTGLNAHQISKSSLIRTGLSAMGYR